MAGISAVALGDNRQRGSINLLKLPAPPARATLTSTQPSRSYLF